MWLLKIPPGWEKSDQVLSCLGEYPLKTIFRNNDRDNSIYF